MAAITVDGQKAVSLGDRYQIGALRASFVRETPSLPFMSFALAPPDKEIGHPLHGSLAVEGSSARDRLCAIMAGDLAFHQHSSSYSSHTMHAFAAKFPPQLPGVFIENLTDPGETVLDPMAGSGTTILEAALRGRRGIGVDIDPLARLIGRVKKRGCVSTEGGH